MRLDDALVSTLRDWDVGHVFGVSGANIEHVHDAINRLGGDRLRSVMARREDGASFMADGRARVHRTLGVCCATSGGGMVNLLAGLAESYAESVPVLALIGQPPLQLEGRGAFQDSSGIGRTVDAVGLLRATTKRVAKIEDPADFWPELHAAAVAALTGRPGPVALLLPRDVFELSVGPRPEDFPAELSALLAPAEAAPHTVRPLFDALRFAERPALLIGHGVRRSGATDVVTEFARRAGVPVVATMAARGEFPNDDPLFLGVAGVVGHPSAHRYLKESDLVVAVGTGLGVMTRGPLGPLDPAHLAVVNIDPGEAERATAPGLVVARDAGAVFRTLLELLDAEPFTAAPPDDYELLRYRPRLAPATGGGRTPRTARDTLRQSEAIRAIEPYLPRDGHIVLDAGNCASAAIHLSHVPEGTSSTIALGMGGMGYSIAAAIGAQLGSAPGTRSVVLCGDGAFLMNGFEVHTAVAERLPVLYVVFNNNMHGMCVTRQQTFFDSRLECVSYPSLDVATVAYGLGGPDRLWVGTAGTLDELQVRLADYHDAHAHLPGVLELRLPVEEVPPFAAFLPEDEPTYAVGRRTDSRVLAG
ncbi:thiamine pyrophosphate-binding protein [Streptomyces hesseae]|uniref:Thiamine pyrophosphate-binding protein n=1 Tax=Streptomyces hesseae TaxID=3075519 RepID=A0ABU2SK70_9ACTN|nr:thiamine pyrophosphate-binding protein [Streptomyces sp. DSM 40473]MDT0448185.1 thiamine pyrophosphate-binding protein [Streptomyces sp. DSM 40473]